MSINSDANCHCKAVEVIPYSDISEVYYVFSSHDQYEFVARRSRSKKILYFSSSDKDQIIKVSLTLIDACHAQLKTGWQSIREAKALHRLTQVLHPSNSRITKHNEILASILHTGFLSLTQDNEELKGAGYELLASACKYLKCEKSLNAPAGEFLRCIGSIFRDFNSALYPSGFPTKRTERIRHSSQ